MVESTSRDRAGRAVAALELTEYTHPTISALGERLRSHGGRPPDLVPVLPEAFHIVNVAIGVTIEDVIEWLVDHVTQRPTLVIIDSISSFVDNMEVDPGDSWGGVHLREITRWTTGVSKLSQGQIAFLLLSEINKEGRAKGRSLDHRCDLAIAMTSGEEDGHEHVKDIRITKNWHGPIGRLGSFVHWWQIARLVRVSDPPL